VDGRCGVEEAAKDGGMPHPDGAPATADGTLEGGTIVLTDASADATLGCTATFYRDADDDGFGDADQSILACAAPAGYVEDATDCYDGNAAAKPGQTEYFTADRGDGSFDYDCIDGPTPEYEGTAACSAFPSCAATPGWTDGDPGCGNTASWLLSCSGLTVVCGQSAESRTQACH
jgi:hypothetical protein